MTDPFGVNMLSAVGSEWSRHRKVVTQSFSEANFPFAFEQTARALDDMFASDWSKKGDRAMLKHVGSTMEKMKEAVLI